MDEALLQTVSAICYRVQNNYPVWYEAYRWPKSSHGALTVAVNTGLLRLVEMMLKSRDAHGNDSLNEGTG